MRLKFLIEKEFLQIRRNAFLPRMIVMFPIFLICVAPLIMNMEVKDVRVAIVDNDHSTLSQRLVNRVSQSTYFELKEVAPSYAHAMKAMEKDEVDVIAVIPQDYERDLTNGARPQVYIAANSVNGIKGSMGASYLTQIVAQNLNHSTEASTPFATKAYYNPKQDYKVFMIPALMAMLIVMMCGFMPALNIVGEKEDGTIEQINVTPVGKWEFILAKLIPYWIIGLFVLTVALLLAWGVYGIFPVGNIGIIYVGAILLAFVFSGLGLVVSNYSSAIQQAMLVMWFIMVCCILLSGLFTPIHSMPEWAQWLTRLNPMAYFIEVMRIVFVRGGSAMAVSRQLCTLCAFALVFNAWAVWSYRKNQ